MITETTTNKGLTLKIGSTYIIDKECANGGEVQLVAIYGKIFCRVKDPDTDSEWDTMINRLSEVCPT